MNSDTKLHFISIFFPEQLGDTSVIVQDVVYYRLIREIRWNVTDSNIDVAICKCKTSLTLQFSIKSRANFDAQFLFFRVKSTSCSDLDTISSKFPGPKLISFVDSKCQICLSHSGICKLQYNLVCSRRRFLITF